MAQSVAKSLYQKFFAGRDGCTADAEHRRQQQGRHIYIVYGPPHAPCPWFGMSAMFRATAAEVWQLLISSQDLGGDWDGKFASLAPTHRFLQGFLHLTWVGTQAKFLLRALAEYMRSPSHPVPWFGMSAMFRATAAKVWQLLISSRDLGGDRDGKFASLATPHHFLPGFLHFTWVGTQSKFMLRALAENVRNALDYSLQSYY